MSLIGVVVPVGKWVYTGGEYEVEGDSRHTIHPLTSLQYPHHMGFESMPTPDQLPARFQATSEALNRSSQELFASYSRNHPHLPKITDVEVKVNWIDLFIFDEAHDTPSPSQIEDGVWGMRPGQQPPLAHFRFDGETCMQIEIGSGD